MNKKSIMGIAILATCIIALSGCLSTEKQTSEPRIPPPPSTPVTGEYNQQENDCTLHLQSFDDSIKKFYLPANLPAGGSNPDFLCTGLDFTTDFSKLKPKWVIAKLEKKEIEEDTLILTFKGINEIQKWFTTKEDYSKYQEGNYYQIDMYNFCRNYLTVKCRHLYYYVL